jgi:hypothetical protein
MRRIANHISLLLCLVFCACTATEPTGNFDGHNVSIAYLWSLCDDRSVAIKDDLRIQGFVVANNKLGELHRSIVVADETGGIEIKIDCDDTDLHFPLYSEVDVRCSGLHIGREGLKSVLGTPPTAEYVVDRIAESQMHNIIDVRHTAIAPPRAIRRKISELSSYDMLNYIRIDSVRFADEELGKRWVAYGDDGKPQTTIHHITDGTHFARVVVDKGVIYGIEELPSGEFFCIGILDYHDGDLALRITNHQVITYE